MNHIEAQILDGVARLHPDVFGARAEYCARHARLPRLHRSRGLTARCSSTLPTWSWSSRCGPPACRSAIPRVAHSKEVAVSDTFDVALARQARARASPGRLQRLLPPGPERMFVVSGPNNGGKTTFARMFGQLHYLASLGLLVPGREARLFLPDRIFTHFEREEDIETLRGKFEDELVRVQRDARAGDLEQRHRHERELQFDLAE